MHAFVKRGQPIKIKFIGGKSRYAVDARDAALDDLVHIAERLLTARQQKLPARVMGDVSRIVQPIAVFEQRFFLTQVAQSPKFLSPGDVTDFPQRRIDDRDARTNHLAFVEVGDESQCASAEFTHGGDQLTRAHGGERAAHLLFKNGTPKRIRSSKASQCTMCLQPLTMWRLICGCFFFSNSARSPACARSSRPNIINSGIFSSVSRSHKGLAAAAAPPAGAS